MDIEYMIPIRKFRKYELVYRCCDDCLMNSWLELSKGFQTAVKNVKIFEGMHNHDKSTFSPCTTCSSPQCGVTLKISACTPDTCVHACITIVSVCFIDKIKHQIMNGVNVGLNCYYRDTTLLHRAVIDAAEKGTVFYMLINSFSFDVFYLN